MKGIIMSEALKEKSESFDIQEVLEMIRLNPDPKRKYKAEINDGLVVEIHVLEQKKPPKRSKEELDVAREKIKSLVKENARELKEQGLTVKDVLKEMPKIRAQLIKEKYGI